MRIERHLGLGVVALVVLGVLLFFFDGQPTQAPIREIETKALPANHMASLAKRPVFPYSVVPGGTQTGAEANAMAQLDPTVGRHYAALDLKKLSPVQVSKGTSAFVSYRVGNRIYWTSKRLYLREGEKLLTDGKLFLRARCGNRVSQEPMQPTLTKSEPSEDELDRPNWDTPLFQAMVREANVREGEELFRLPGAGPQSIATLKTDLPDSLFSVMPGVVAGILGGGLPGGVAGSVSPGGITGNGGNFTGPVVFAGLEGSRPPVFEEFRPPILPNLLFPIGPGYVEFRPPEILPPILIASNLPPVVPGLILPPPLTVYTPPVLAGGLGPVVLPGVLPPGGGGGEAIVPPGVVTPPVTSGPPIISTPPITSAPGNGPPTDTPPDGGPFVPEPIPEPGSLWIVPIGLALLYQYKRRS